MNKYEHICLASNFFSSYTAHELLQPGVCKDLYGRAKLSEASHQYWREERATPKEARGDNSWNRRIA